MSPSPDAMISRVIWSYFLLFALHLRHSHMRDQDLRPESESEATLNVLDPLRSDSYFSTEQIQQVVLLLVRCPGTPQKIDKLSGPLMERPVLE